MVVTGTLSSPTQYIPPTYQPTGWTVIYPVSTGNFFETTLAAGSLNTIIMGLGGPIGQTINIQITQHPTSPGTIGWSSNIKFADGFDSSASTGAGDIDVWSLITFDGSDYYVTGLKNFS